jgi:glycosyltransferase involved in cell wall biosynthesis
MRIAIVIHEYPPVGGGAATAAAQTARALAGLGHQVQVITAGGPGLARRARDGDVAIRRLPTLRLSTLAPGALELISFCASAQLGLTRALRRFGADAVIAYFAVPAGVFTTAAARRLQIPCVVSLRGSDVPGFVDGRLSGPLGRLAHPAVRRALRRAHRVAPNSQVLADLVSSFCPEIAADLAIVRNGIEPSAVAERPASSTGPELHLIQVGQLIRRKRVGVTLEALRKLADVPLKLTVIGSGPLEAELRAAAEGLPVDFAGHLPRAEILERLRSCDLFVMSSAAEGMSNAMFEAIAAGLPVITSANGSHDLVEVAGCGRVVPVDDPEALAANIRALARDRDERLRLANAGLAYARSRSWAVCAGELVELFG